MTCDAQEHFSAVILPRDLEPTISASIIMWPGLGLKMFALGMAGSTFSERFDMPEEWRAAILTDRYHGGSGGSRDNNGGGGGYPSNGGGGGGNGGGARGGYIGGNEWEGGRSRSGGGGRRDIGERGGRSDGGRGGKKADLGIWN